MVGAKRVPRQIDTDTRRTRHVSEVGQQPVGDIGHRRRTRVRRDASLDAIRLIALSGYGRDEDRRQSREAGFDAHLIKPVEFAELRRLLSEPG